MLTFSQSTHWTNNKAETTAGRRKAANIQEMIKKVENEIKNSEMSMNNFQSETGNRYTYNSQNHNQFSSNYLQENSSHYNTVQNNYQTNISDFQNENQVNPLQQEVLESCYRSLHNGCISAKGFTSELMKRDEEIVAALTACLKQQIVPQIKSSVLKEIRSEIQEIREIGNNKNLNLINEQLSQLRQSFEKSKSNKIQIPIQNDNLNDKIIYLESLCENFKPLIDSIYPIIKTIQPILDTLPTIQDLKPMLEIIPNVESLRKLMKTFPSMEVFNQLMQKMQQVEEFLPKVLFQQEQIASESSKLQEEMRILEKKIVKLEEIPQKNESNVIFSNRAIQLNSRNSTNMSGKKTQRNENMKNVHAQSNTLYTDIIQSLSFDENLKEKRSQKQIIGRYSNRVEEDNDDPIESKVIQQCDFSSPFFEKNNNNKCNYEISSSIQVQNEQFMKEYEEKRREQVSEVLENNLSSNRQLFPNVSPIQNEVLTSRALQLGQKENEFISSSLANSDNINFVKKGIPQLFPLVNSTYFAKNPTCNTPHQSQSIQNQSLINSEDPVLFSELNSQTWSSQNEQINL